MKVLSGERQYLIKALRRWPWLEFEHCVKIFEVENKDIL
jgi:hypothetical protein